MVPHSKWLDLNQREWKHQDAKVLFPFKFNKCYFPKGNDWLKWKVDESKLSEKNKKVLEQIRNNHTCFVHVRRGDYLASNNKSIFEGCVRWNITRRHLSFCKISIPISSLYASLMICNG